MSEEANKKDFLGECEHFFGSRSLYEVLGVEEDAGEAEIKSAYRKKSLKVHPDRAPEDRKEHAKQAFQTLTKVFFCFWNIEIINNNPSLGSRHSDDGESS